MLRRSINTLVIIIQVLTCHALAASLLVTDRNGLALFLGLSFLFGIVFPDASINAVKAMYRFYMTIATYVGYGACLLGAALGSLGMVIGSIKEDTALRELGFQLLGYCVGGAIALYFVLTVIRNLCESPDSPALPVREEKKIATHAAFNELEMDELRYES